MSSTVTSSSNDNIIMHSDAIAFLESLPDSSVDLIVADPPYDISAGRSGVSSIGSLHKYNKGNASGDNLFSISKGFDIAGTLKEFKRVLKRFNAYIFCSKKQLYELMTFAITNNYYYELLVWHKTNSTPFANGTWRQDIEWVVYMSEYPNASDIMESITFERDCEYVIQIRDKGTVFQGGAAIKKKVKSHPYVISKHGHPTEKPLEIIEAYITISSNAGDVICDPFMGSGTTGHAAAKLGRVFYGCDNNAEYFLAAKRRIEGAYGETHFKDLPMFQ